MNYVLHILVMINIYVILSLSLNLIVGYAGLLSICQAAFYGIGAYTSALLTLHFGMNFIPALLLGIIMASAMSLIVAIPSLRLKGDYFLLSTLGFQIIVYSLFYNLIPLTKGPYGLPGIPSASLFGFEFSDPPKFFLLSLIFVVLCLFFKRTLVHSPFGRLLKAIREDEIAAQSLGKDTTRAKIIAFMIGCGMAAIAGSLFAHYVTYIDPTSFTLDESIFILCILIIGGMGNIKGPVVGAVLLIIIPEILRFLNVPNAILANLRQIIYALLLILFIRFRPNGILGVYKFE